MTTVSDNACISIEENSMQNDDNTIDQEQDKQVEVNMESEIKTEHFETSCELKAESEQEGTFVGYGSIFGNKDLGNDIVEKGAFLKSINDRGARGVKMLWQHKTDAPIGIFNEIREDNKGLRVEGQLAMGTQGGREAYELMKMGALDGMSIGYKADPAKQIYDPKGKKRHLKELDLMEINLVTFPMNTRARIQAVKGEEMNIRDLEKGLRDAFSFSRSDAKVGAKALHDIFNKQRDAENKGDIELLEAIRQTTTFLTKITKE